MNTAIPMDADNFDPAAAFLEKWKDAETSSDPEENEDTNEEERPDDSEHEAPESDERGDDDESETEADETDTSEEDAEPDSEEEEGEDDQSAVKTVIDSDDAVVKIKVDGEEVEASIKDLKRLYGQEASLTRKSQEAATIKKRAEEAGAYHVAGLEALYQRAVEAAKPYQNINFLALAKDPDVSKEELEALSSVAQSAFDNVRYLETELQNVTKFAQEQRHNQLVEQAKETHKVLSDPKTGIEGWGEPLYNEIRDFAVKQGLDAGIVNEIVDPVGIKILHMAMKYAKGMQAVKTPKKGPTKVDKTPKKIVKGAPQEVVRKTKTNKATEAAKRLRASGSEDDAAAAFLARWENS
jgi:hypothetical protein